jgi:hypothetical protein
LIGKALQSGEPEMRGVIKGPEYGLVLFQAPGRRQRIQRTRLIAVSVTVLLLLASGVVGGLIAPGIDPVGGPFSYYPN